jgi:hypothetical protein
VKIRFVSIRARFSPSELSNEERRPVIGKKAEFVGNIVPHGSRFLSNEMLAVIDTEALAEVASLDLGKCLTGFDDDGLLPQVQDAALRWNRASHDETFEGGRDSALELACGVEAETRYERISGLAQNAAYPLVQGELQPSQRQGGDWAGILPIVVRRGPETTNERCVARYV